MLPPYSYRKWRRASFDIHGRYPFSFLRKGFAVTAPSTAKRDAAHETVEFDSLPVELIDQSTKETVDEKLVLELLGQLLLTASQSHRTFLEEQEKSVRELMQKIPDSPRTVEAELAKVYQQIRASFARLVEAIGDIS
jgi:hypothetical protein